MRIHHLNCGTDCPLGGALFDGRSVSPLGRLVCHCLLIETDSHGLVLVDTGYGLRDIDHPHRPAETRGGLEQVRRLGCAERQRHIEDRRIAKHAPVIGGHAARHVDRDPKPGSFGQSRER